MIDTIKGYIDLDKLNIPRHQIDRLIMTSEVNKQSGCEERSNTVFRTWTKHNKLFIEGSLCKYHFNDNLHTLTRQEAKHAINKLALELKLPIHDFIVTRIDFAENIKTRSRVETYVDAFEGIDKWKDTNYVLKQTTTGKLFEQSDKALCIYNKILEYSFKQKYKNRGKYHINNSSEKQVVIPKIDFEQENWLRVELRLKKNVGKQLMGRSITIGEITNKVVYNKLVRNWFVTICNITYRETLMPTLEDIEGLKDFQRILMQGGIQFFNGYANVLNTVRKFRPKDSSEKTRKQRLVKLIKTLRVNDQLYSHGKTLFFEVRRKATHLALFYLGKREEPSFKVNPKVKNRFNLN